MEIEAEILKLLGAALPRLGQEKAEAVAHHLVEELGASSMEDLSHLVETDLVPLLKVFEARKLMAHVKGISPALALIMVIDY